MSEMFADDFVYREEIHTELIDGKVVKMSPRARPNHNSAALNIASAFNQFLIGKACKVYFETDVILSDKDRFVPDIAVVCNPEIVKHNGIHGAPDLVVEVLSPRTHRYDRGYKKKTYALHGVKEYWIVDVKNRVIEVHYLKEGKFDLDTDNVYNLYPSYDIKDMKRDNIEPQEIIKSKFSPSMFPDLVFDLEEVFDGLIPDEF